MYNLSKPQKLIYDMEKYAGGSIATICGSIIIKGSKEIEDIKRAINELYRINDALRIRITETDRTPQQYVTEYTEQKINVLHFKNKAELDLYADEYAKEPMDFYGSLCHINAVVLEDGYGILVKLHHIISDAWTLSLVGSQFNAVVNGKIPEVNSYIDYISSEQEYLSGKRWQKDHEYCMEQFKKCDDVTYLSDKQAKNYTAKRKTFIIDTGKTLRIAEYAKLNNTSIYILLMTALGVYLNRIKMNQEKFYVGTAILNRTGVKEKNTMGMFINTIPILFELDNNLTFRENLRNCSRSMMTMLRHQKFNYGDVLKTLRSEFDFSGNLYDAMFSYQNAKFTGIDTDFESSWYHCGMQTESLQIHVDDRDSEGILKIHYDYQVEKFTEKEIDRMHEHLFNLLFDAINEDKKITELSILSEKEKNTLLYDFNNTKTDYPKDKCVHQLFEEQVLKTPDKTAVIACDKALTYDELNKLSNRIANALIEKGIGVGDIVAFALPRRSYLIATMFGILKSGAAYMPIDPDYPRERIDFMLSDSGARVFITEKNLREFISGNKINPKIKVDSENYCYCIYTSGTTGNPKGILIRHRNLVNFCDNNNNNKYQNSVTTYGTRLISISQCCFDAFGVDYALFLLNGLSLVLVNDNDIVNAEKLTHLIKKYNADVIQTTPSIIKTLLNNEHFIDAICNAKSILVAAESFTRDLYEFLRKKTSAKIFNGYGPSETTIGVSIGEVVSNNISIGKPIANTQIYILDKFNNPMPIGVTGELCIAGDGVGAGYLNRPELTAEKFVDNPFGEGKMYKTGDLAYWREDGNIMFVGRSDFQVKIRGLRIELGEIENVIAGTEGVSQAVVVVRRDESGRQLICAFYTEKAHVELAKIKENILKKLPKYMLPHIFTVLDEMPLTPSGKINRKALPEVDLHVKSEVLYVMPRTENEKILAEAAQKVLQIEKVGMADNFFDLGGDSLKAIELLGKLEAQGCSAEIKDVFGAGNFGELAQKLRIKASELTCVIEGDMPATEPQMRVYTAQSMNEGTTLYNVPYAFKVQNLDAERLKRAIEKLISRHEALRTQFENRNGKVMQIVLPKVEFALERLESGEISDFVRPFDLSKAPLIRAGYYENIVMLDMHHIICDGGTMAVILKELNELYMGRELPPAVQYREFASEEKDLSESEKYWLSVYNDELPELEIRTDYPRGQKQSFKGSAVYSVIDIKLHDRIKEKCRELNVTPFVFYMGAFNILLSKFSGNEDIIVGMPASGRGGRFLNTAGMFVNTVALRNKPVGTKTVSRFLDEVKENSVEAIKHQDYPYGEMIKQLKIEPQGRNPLFDVMLAYQSEATTDVVFGDEKAELLPVPVTTSKYDFTFNIMPRENDVVLMAEYCTDLYGEKTVNRLIGGFKLVLEQMLYRDTEIKDISAISAEETKRLLYEFNDTKADYPKDKCVHELFEEQAAKTPDKTAVIACDKTLTYDELNKASNRIANSLIDRGVKTNDIVAFALPRTSFLIAVIFGILKSGAAYMPIDPDYPQERIDFMLSDSNAKFFITESNLNEFISYNNENPNVKMNSDNYCYCIYTSGSTGKPKGTLLYHKGIINLVTNLTIYRDISKINTFGFMTTITFDVASQEIFTALLNGFTGVLFPERKQTDIKEIIDTIEKQNIDIIYATPSYFDALTSTKENAARVLKVLNTVALAGEKFYLNSTVQELIPDNDITFENQYGPVELHVIAATASLKDNDYDSIGKPIANNQAYILDKYNNPMPIGQIGELCIAGDGVGAGYLNRPELTAEKFVDNPFGEGKMYKTGDLAYWREDGNIMFVGRSDFQVKIRGLRIELGEIENAILQTEGISQAVVVVRRDESGRQLICAFYTEKAHVETAKIKENILKKLPKYMLPHIFTALSEMPLTASGKINRKALPEVDLHTASETEYVRPQTDLQKAMAEIMGEVLNYSPVGLNDDFFDLGGDSLKAIELLAKAHNEGIYFNLQTIFDSPTVEKLCKYIESGGREQLRYDETEFADINTILSKNTAANISAVKTGSVGNILLAGATGYLGIHILADFLDNDSGIAYCLVRGENTEQSKSRLKELLQFYFDDKYSDLIGTRIKVLCSDLTKENLGLCNDDYVNLTQNVCTVINAAASVKHYGSYKYFYETNVGTVKHLIDFCRKSNARLIHASTLSVSGNSMGDNFDGYISETEKHFYESSLYIGQPLENVYARSKFEAEKEILSAMANGLKANIMRMGNLTNRLSDGKFQKNHESNAFLKRVRAILNLGILPEYLTEMYLEFTPIDEAANAVMTIARHFSEEQTVFHINSPKVVYMDKLLKIFKKIGINMRIADGKTFTDALRETAKQANTEFIFEAFINDMDSEDKLNYDSNIRIENDFTVDYLRKLGFEWSDIGEEYLKKYIEWFRKVGYLEV